MDTWLEYDFAKGRIKHLREVEGGVMNSVHNATIGRLHGLSPRIAAPIGSPLTLRVILVDDTCLMHATALSRL
jgi:hypothetical protein